MCAEQLAKIILIVINVGFFIGGGAILAVGIIAYVREDLLLDITDFLTGTLADTFSQLEILTTVDLNGLLRDNAIIIMVVGGVLFAIGFLGCCGAMRKNKTCLNIYAIVVLVILMAQVALGVYAYMASDSLEAQIQNGLKMAVNEEYGTGMRFKTNSDDLEESTDGLEQAWDSLQLEVQCCGVVSADEWGSDTLLWNQTYLYNALIYADVQLPPSCCKRTTAGLDTEITDLTKDDFEDIIGCMRLKTPDTFHTDACYDRLRAIIVGNQKIIIGVFIVIVIIEILGISCACWLKSKGEDKD